MAGIWVAPPRGDILNDGAGWRVNDVVDQLLTINVSGPSRIELTGGTLPPGLIFDAASRRVRGTIGSLPKDVTRYPVVFRATNDTTGRQYDRSLTWVVDPRDLEQRWAGGQGTQDLGSWPRGSSILIPLLLTNTDGDQLTFEVVGHRGPQGSWSGLPVGLTVDQWGRITGSPTITGNQPGVYWFRIYARDAEDATRNPRGEGSPRTSDKLFKITLTQDITLDARLSDVVRWETPPGSLGSTWESFASHFSVRATPQYQVEGAAGEVSEIRYSLVTASRPLPEGLRLDERSGLILGRCPFVSTTKSHEFTVEARVVFVNQDTNAVRPAAISSQRTFSIVIRSMFASDGVTSLHAAVPGPARQKIAQWLWGNLADPRSGEQVNQVFSADRIFRAEDENFGRRRSLDIMIASGLSYTGDLTSQLTDYHRPTTLRIGSPRSAVARSPEGVHLYDVVYLEVLDPQEGAGGFDAQGREESLSRYRVGQQPRAIESWNLTAQQPNFYPASIRNMRADLINRTYRLPGAQTLGLSGIEALPLWMRGEQVAGDPSSILGYRCAIELAAVRPGSGDAVVKSLILAGIMEDLGGSPVTMDRYLLLSSGASSTTFDGELGEPTTFDGPENSVTPTLLETSLDTQLITESKYYKFPPGDGVST